MTVQEFIDHCAQQIASGDINPDAELMGEYCEDVGEIFELYQSEDKKRAFVMVFQFQEW